MEVAFILCDAAQVSPDGKTHILGAGWRFCGPRVGPHTVVAFIAMSAEDVGVHQLVLDLVDEDGRPLMVPDEQGGQGALRIEGEVHVVLPPDHRTGQVFDVPFVVPLGPGLPLRPGGTYVWQLWIDGNTRDDWRYPFYVRPEPPA